MKQNNYSNRNHFWETGKDDKNLKNYSSYPDEVQDRKKIVRSIKRNLRKVIKLLRSYFTFCYFCSYYLYEDCLSKKITLHIISKELYRNLKKHIEAST